MEGVGHLQDPSYHQGLAPLGLEVFFSQVIETNTGAWGWAGITRNFPCPVTPTSSGGPFGATSSASV